MAKAAVVLVVGAKPSGQASSLTLTLSTTSPALAESRFGIAGDHDQLKTMKLEMGQ